MRYGSGESGESPWDGLAEVLTMSVPIIMGMASFAVTRFVDTWMVAKLPGDTALAAVGQSGLAVFTLATFFVGVVGCVSTFVAQSLGRGAKQDCARYAWQGIYLSAGTLVLAIAGWPLSRPLFESLGHPPEVTSQELVYFRIRLLGFVFITWQTGLASFFQAVGRPRLPMYSAIVANGTNVVLNYFLIFGKWGFPRWEIAGAAVATVLAQAVEVSILMAVFLGPRFRREYGSWSARQIDLKRMTELLRIGWPAGLSILSDVFNWSIFTMIIVGRFGEAAMAAHNVAIQFCHLAFMPALGVNQAIAAIVGLYIGRGSIPLAKNRTYMGMILAATYMTLVGVSLAVFGRPLIVFFFSSDPEVVRLGHSLLILAALFQAFDAINIVLFGALRGAGDTWWMLKTTFCIGYLFFVPLACLLAITLGWGAVGAWIGASIYIVLLSGTVFWRWRGEQWTRVQIFAGEESPVKDP